MSKMEMKDEVETDVFTDELSDEALDRQSPGGARASTQANCAFTVFVGPDRN